MKEELPGHGKLIGIAKTYAKSYKADTDTMYDFIAEAVYGALKARSKYNGQGPEENFLVVSGLNRMKDFARKRCLVKRHEWGSDALADLHLVDEQFEKRLDCYLHADNIARRSVKHKLEATIVALEFHGITNEEGARLAGVTLPAYKSRLYRLQRRRRVKDPAA